MSAILDHHLAERLARICGMFGSSHDGERAAAAALADRMVREHGLTWPDIIAPSPPPPAPVTPRWREPESHVEAAAVCLEWGEHFTAWERGFCASVARIDRLSEKQARVLARLVDRARAFALAGGAA